MGHDPLHKEYWDLLTRTPSACGGPAAADRRPSPSLIRPWHKRTSTVNTHRVQRSQIQTDFKLFYYFFSQISVKLSLNWENAAAPRQTIDTLWCWTHNKSCKIPKILFWLQRNKMATAVRTNAVVHKPTSGVTTTNRRNSSSCEFMLLTVSPLHAN